MPKTVQRDYWSRFLHARNLVGPIMEETRAVEAGSPEPVVENDIQLFIDRVTQRVVPIHEDYNPNVKRKLQAVRQRYRKELTNVFNGKTSLKKWFNQTRRDIGLHQIDLTRILYESLKGLKSSEAKALRNHYAQTLQTIASTYRPPI